MPRSVFMATSLPDLIMLNLSLQIFTAWPVVNDWMPVSGDGLAQGGRGTGKHPRDCGLVELKDPAAENTAWSGSTLPVTQRRPRTRDTLPPQDLITYSHHSYPLSFLQEKNPMGLHSPTPHTAH